MGIITRRAFSCGFNSRSLLQEIISEKRLWCYQAHSRVQIQFLTCIYFIGLKHKKCSQEHVQNPQRHHSENIQQMNLAVNAEMVEDGCDPFSCKRRKKKLFNDSISPDAAASKDFIEPDCRLPKITAGSGPIGVNRLGNGKWHSFKINDSYKGKIKKGYEFHNEP